MLNVQCTVYAQIDSTETEPSVVVLLRQLWQILIVATWFSLLFLSYKLKFGFASMALTTEDKVLTVEIYFWPFGLARPGWAKFVTLCKVSCQEHFHKNPLSSAMIVSVVGQFRRSDSFLTQRKGLSSRPITVCSIKNHRNMEERCIKRYSHQKKVY